jgi:hypothetical protein
LEPEGREVLKLFTFYWFPIQILYILTNYLRWLIFFHVKKSKKKRFSETV